jgi:hypothetical protein
MQHVRKSTIKIFTRQISAEEADTFFEAPRLRCHEKPFAIRKPVFQSFSSRFFQILLPRHE